VALLADRHAAEDATQAAFIKAYLRLEGFRGQAAFGTWLTRIAINTCKDEKRRRARRPEQSLDLHLESGAPLPKSLVQGPGDSAALPLPQALLERLSPAELNLLDLAASDGEPGYADMGQRLGLSVDSVKGRLKRVRQKLRRLWGAQKDES
jgi:RNA polymerase sigma-70 factor (ECF subfamily)